MAISKRSTPPYRENVLHYSPLNRSATRDNFFYLLLLPTFVVATSRQAGRRRRLPQTRSRTMDMFVTLCCCAMLSCLHTSYLFLSHSLYIRMKTYRFASHTRDCIADTFVRFCATRKYDFNDFLVNRIFNLILHIRMHIFLNFTFT